MEGNHTSSDDCSDSSDSSSDSSDGSSDSSNATEWSFDDFDMMTLPCCHSSTTTLSWQI
jgi:hypothetical protein